LSARTAPSITDDASSAAEPDPRVGVVAGPIEVTTAGRSFPGFAILAAAAVVTVAAMAGQTLIGRVGGAKSTAGVLGPVLLVVLVWLARRLIGRGADPSVSVRRFRVQPVSGRTTSYILEGEVPPDALRTGDLVRVHGRRVRDGHVVARSIDVLATLGGPAVRAVVGRPSTVILAAQWLSQLSIVLAVLMLVSTAYLVAGALL
jgi:hypothetical protein